MHVRSSTGALCQWRCVLCRTLCSVPSDIVVDERLFASFGSSFTLYGHMHALPCGHVTLTCIVLLYPHLCPANTSACTYCLLVLCLDDSHLTLCFFLLCTGAVCPVRHRALVRTLLALRHMCLCTDLALCIVQPRDARHRVDATRCALETPAYLHR